MSKLSFIAFGVLAELVFVSATASAAGISVDAGLTPAEDRWILRTQIRRMRRTNDPTSMSREMRTYAYRTVLAYGVRPDFTLMARQDVQSQKKTMSGTSSEHTGLGDLMVMGKYKLFRRNTPEYTFGVAGTLGIEFPTGDDSFSSKTWDLRPGLYTSWRSGPWASDFNISYAWNGFSDTDDYGVNPGNKLSLDWALAHQFSIGQEGRASFAPVVELSYEKIEADRLSGRRVTNTGESVFYVSPGAKLTISSFILESLVRIPVWQEQEGSQLERGVDFIIGIRYMF